MEKEACVHTITKVLCITPLLLMMLMSAPPNLIRARCLPKDADCTQQREKSQVLAKTRKKVNLKVHWVTLMESRFKRRL